MEDPVINTEDISKIAEALVADETEVEADELSSETIEAEGPEPEATGITSHILRCRQGLGNAYNYDNSTFRPPSTGLMYTRTTFYTTQLVRCY